MRNKVYFASDLHLGYPNAEESLVRERLIIKWLDSIKEDAKAIYLLGDVFDFWYEWKRVIPKGFTRFFGKLAELVDNGINIYFFTGNHDIWAFDYLEKEIGITVYRKERDVIINGKTFHLAHGDGLGPGDKGFKLMKWLFSNSVAQWFFSRVHPNFSMWIGSYWSQQHRYFSREPIDRGEKEWIIQYSRSILKEKHIDFFIYGHRHFPVDKNLTEKSRYINTGDWLINFTYAIFDGEELYLKEFEPALSFKSKIKMYKEQK